MLKTGDVHTGFWWEYPMERGHLENIGVDGAIILKRISNKCVGKVWS
jgi:hypothetical protein